MSVPTPLIIYKSEMMPPVSPPLPLQSYAKSIIFLVVQTSDIQKLKIEIIFKPFQAIRSCTDPRLQ